MAGITLMCSPFPLKSLTGIGRKIEFRQLCCILGKAFKETKMNSPRNYWKRFIAYREKYPLTVSLFGETNFQKAFKEIGDVLEELSGKHSDSDSKMYLGEILLNRWTPIHHAFFGAVFELETYKDRDPFLLEKCERYQLFLFDKLGNEKRGVKGLRKDLGNFENFQKGIFFEMEADVLLAKITSPPQELRKQVKANSRRDVDFVGIWNGLVLNFEIKSLTESPKYLAKGSKEIDGIGGISIGWSTFVQDRRKRIKDILAEEVMRKFELGANNLVVMPDADRLPTESKELECVIQDLVTSDSEISERILAVMMYRTGLLIEKPWNRRSIMVKVGSCPNWVNDFFRAFCSTDV